MCDFKVQQHGDGRLLIYCTFDDAFSAWQLCATNGTAKLDGQTSGGQAFSTEGPLHWLRVQGQTCILLAAKAVFGQNTEIVAKHIFALTNLIFSGTPLDRPPRSISLLIESVPVELHPSAEYTTREQLVSLNNETHATAYLSIESPLPSDEAIQRASDLCYALSVVQGHKVNWIDHTILDTNGEPLRCSLEKQGDKNL